jgi:non-specific serine/threonine protein kinase
VFQVLAERLDVTEDPGDESLLQRLETYLQDREMLLILDNVEQVLPAASGLAELLVAAPRVTLLATSREALHLRREQTFHVPPLALPDPEHLPLLEELSQIPSLALFLQRAQAIDPDFALTDDNARAVAELCVHLDGLPLAIELAAARTTLLSPQMILERLGQRLSLLRWQARDLPERQQTLGAAITWSYDLLADDEQALFRRLGVFAGSFSLEAAEAIAAGGHAVGTPRDSAWVSPPGVDALEGLASLVDKSLVQVQGMEGDTVRYVLLESIRDYALERLAEAGELDAAGRIHALYYLALAERAEPELTGREQRTWFRRLELAHENLRAALCWFGDHGESELGLRLATALGYFWEARGYMAEGQRQLEEALAQAPVVDVHLRARALSRLGALLMWSTEGERAKVVLIEALDLARSVGDTLGIAWSLSYLGSLGVYAQEWDQSKCFLAEALTSWQETQDAWGIAYALHYLGAIELMEEHREEAERLLEESVARYREMGDESARGLALLWLMTARGEQGEVAGAATLLQEVLSSSSKVQDRRLLLLCAAGVAWLLRDQGDPEELARLLGAVEAMRRATGFAGNLLIRTREAIASESLLSRLGQEASEAARAAGRSLSFEQMAGLIQAALDGAIPVGAPEKAAQEPRPHTLLSPREQEVLHLVAQGFPNKQIAQELIVAESTVRYHLTSVFNKLGVDTRTHAVAVAAQRGLISLGQQVG